MVKSMLLAIGFLTRIPVPEPKRPGTGRSGMGRQNPRQSATGQQRPHNLARAAWAFPLVGMGIGALVAACLVLLDGRPLVAAWLAFLMWVLITGGLHLDGLADVTDGFGAAHKDPERFRRVAKDPHIGGYGTAAIAVQLISTVVLLLALPTRYSWAILLIPAWARWTAVLTPVLVPALGDGMAALMGRRHWPAVIVWALILGVLSGWLAPVLLVALVVAPVLAAWWHFRLSGFTGDCLGAGIEITETVLLLALVLA